MNYEAFFVAIKERVLADLGEAFDTTILDHLSLSLNYGSQHRSRHRQNDQYRSKTAKIPAYYNPNSHTVHLNIGVVEQAEPTVVENIYYHELVHASSHHAQMSRSSQSVLKSGLKIQLWDINGNPVTLHRGLNEGLTQYLANMYTSGGPAYRREVTIIGKLVRRIGLAPLKAAYFGADIDKLEMVMNVVLGTGALQRLSKLVDAKQFDEAEALLLI